MTTVKDLSFVKSANVALQRQFLLNGYTLDDYDDVLNQAEQQLKQAAMSPDADPALKTALLGVSLPSLGEMQNFMANAPGQAALLLGGALLPGAGIGAAAGYTAAAANDITEDSIEDVRHQEKLQNLKNIEQRLAASRALKQQMQARLDGTLRRNY